MLCPLHGGQAMDRTLHPSQNRGDVKGMFQAKRVVFLFSNSLLGCDCLDILFSTSQQMITTVSGRKCYLLSRSHQQWGNGKQDSSGAKESRHVLKLEHENPNKPLSKCDQKLSILFIAQEVYSLQLLETNKPLHISATISFSKYVFKHILLPGWSRTCS